MTCLFGTCPLSPYFKSLHPQPPTLQSTADRAAEVSTAVGHKVHPMFAAYIVRDKEECLHHQALHRNLDREMMRGRGADHIFFSNFTPIIGQADPTHPQSGFFVPRSELGSPNPWVPQPFNPRPGTFTTINSYVVHAGGAQPPGLTEHAIVAVIGVGFWDCRLHRPLPCPPTPLGIHHERPRHHRHYPS